MNNRTSIACRTMLLILCAAVMTACAKNSDGYWTINGKTIGEHVFGGKEARAESLLAPPREKQDPSLISQGRYECNVGDITIRKKSGAENAWVVTFPAVYMGLLEKGMKTRPSTATTEDFDFFQNGNRLISPDRDVLETFENSKGALIITQIDANTIEVDPDRFPSFYSAGTQGGTQFPEGRCVKK